MQQPPPAGIQVRRSSRRHQQRRRPPGIAGDHRQYRQLACGAGLPEPRRQRDRREPEIALSDLPSQIAGARRRIRRHIDRPQLSHPCAQGADRIPPLQPFGDNRGRHRRAGLQQLPDPRLHRIHNRASRPSPIGRRLVGGQRLLHRVLRTPQHPRDHLNRHPLRPMQPADLRPILHTQHPLPPDLG